MTSEEYRELLRVMIKARMLESTLSEMLDELKKTNTLLNDLLVVKLSK